MTIYTPTDWRDYELLDAGDGERLERWGEFTIRRPDPQIIWPIEREHAQWNKAAAHYHRSSTGGGQWEYKRKLPERWTIAFSSMRFHIKLTNFKHTGLFPEQAVNWQWIIDKIKSANRPVKVLNLFAYTGGATVAAATAGAEVCHVDAAKSSVQWAKENLELSNLSSRPVRFITDDVLKFVQREIRRGKRYDAIIMDPPTYGRGPSGELWKIESDLYPFFQHCVQILSDRPLFVLVNSYTTGLSPTVIYNMLELALKRKFGGQISSGEVGLPITSSKLILPAGIFGRWEEA